MKRRPSKPVKLAAERKRPVAYVAGPMRGIPYFNYPAFDAARDKLFALGFDVINPADLDREETGFNPYTLPATWDWNVIPPGLGDLRTIFLRDTTAICKRVDVIYLLDGYRKSKGARAEKSLCTVLKLMGMRDL